MNDNIEKIEDVLKEKNYFISTISGVSMYPMLRNHKDTIVVRPNKERLKKYDVALYKRNNKYVLHRVIEVLDDGYVILGDNCIEKEYGIKEDQILGVLTEFYRGDRKMNMQSLGYYLYSRIWVNIYPIRVIYKRIRGHLGKVKRAVLEKEKI